jgi:hypothetical protein
MLPTQSPKSFAVDFGNESHQGCSLYHAHRELKTTVALQCLNQSTVSELGSINLNLQT